MTLERRTQALLDLVEQDRRSRCDAIALEARGRAAAMRAQAHAEARSLMRETFAEQRRILEERVSAARARLQTRQRLHAQQRAAAMLALGWQRLPEVLRARWRDEAGRGAWIDAVVAAASRLLPHAQWRVVHGPDWPAAEHRAVAERTVHALDGPPIFAVDERISAGLRIASGGNVVDGTLEGLIADRVDIGAQLLRLLEPS